MQIEGEAGGQDNISVSSVCLKRVAKTETGKWGGKRGSKGES